MKVQHLLFGQSGAHLLKSWSPASDTALLTPLPSTLPVNTGKTMSFSFPACCGERVRHKGKKQTSSSYSSFPCMTPPASPPSSLVIDRILVISAARRLFSSWITDKQHKSGRLNQVFCASEVDLFGLRSWFTCNGYFDFILVLVSLLSNVIYF